MITASDAFGAILNVLALASATTARKRRFDRVNKLGVERFPSFGSKVRGRSADWLLIGTAIVFGVVGSVLLAFNHLDSWGWIVAAPVWLFMLYLVVEN